jgi:hypothetical protein
MEADTAINKLDIRDQPYMRQITANKIQKLINKQNEKNDSRRTFKEKLAALEEKLIINIKNKIKQHQLILTKADKGNTLVIINQEDYDRKVNEFISNNNYTKLTCDITNKLQRSIRNILNKCNTIIDKHNKWKYSNMYPRAPQIYGTIKLHK